MAIGQIYNRDKFLQRIRSKLNRPKPEKLARPSWPHAPQHEVLKDLTQDELVEVLINQCELIHTKAYQTTSDEFPATLQDIIQKESAKSIVISNDHRYEQFGLTNFFKQELPANGVNVHQWDPALGREKNIANAERADIGITFSDITLAESGTVVLFSNADTGRTVSLLPTTYIAIIPKSTIVPRMTQATAEIHRRVQRGEAIPSCINFISGPSNSADIEMNLVVGVHGPVRAYYVIVMDK